MSDFNEEIKEIVAQGRTQADKQKRAMAEEHEKQIAAERAQQDALNKAYGVASQFAQKFIEPRMREIQQEIPGGMLHIENEKDSAFAGCNLKFGDAEYLVIRLHFDEKNLWLSAETQCVRQGEIYHEESEHFDCGPFDEAKAQTWMESHILEALKAFCAHAEVIRNPTPVVRYISDGQ